MWDRLVAATATGNAGTAPAAVLGAVTASTTAAAVATTTPPTATRPDAGVNDQAAHPATINVSTLTRMASRGPVQPPDAGDVIRATLSPSRASRLRARRHHTGH